MRRRPYRLVAIVIVCALAGVAYLSFRQSDEPVQPAAARTDKSLQRPPATVDSPPGVINRGLPSRLTIPKLHVDAKIGYLGLTKGGDMEVPANVQDAGWYKYGALPGNKGSAVIAGHLNGLRGEPGVFAELGKLQKNDSFSVTDTKGQSATFIVRTTRTYGQNEKPQEVFNEADGVHLNLITCTGTWDRTERQYSQRLVVFADQLP